MTANDLIIVIRARDEAAKALASVQGQLGLIVEAAQAANEAIAQIAETAAPAVAAASQAAAAAQTAAPQIDTGSLAAAGQALNQVELPEVQTAGLASLGEVMKTVAGQAVDLLTTLGACGVGSWRFKTLPAWPEMPCTVLGCGSLTCKTP